MTEQEFSDEFINSGERQVAATIDDIRNDHVSRYVWAEALMPQGAAVLDLGCGIGYGAHYMHKRGHDVMAVDNNEDALKYGRLNYAGPNYESTDLAAKKMPVTDATQATAFEILEHLKNPAEMLSRLPDTVERLFCSVPNEDYFPHKGPGHEKGYKYHERHYTEHEFTSLLWEAGWRVDTMRHQTGPETAVGNVPGRTLVAQCVRKSAWKPRGARIAILALGPSLNGYTEIAKRCGGRYARFDEVWGINALGDVYACDRVFHMDDVRIQAARSEELPNSNIAVMHKWLKTHPGPIYTSHVEPGYPGLVQFPLEAVVHDLGVAYFNSTVAYAIAMAIHERASHISIYGADFTYPNAHHAEKGRACVEFWIAMARSRGIVTTFPRTSSLMDACLPHTEAFYGFCDGYDIEIKETNAIELLPRDELPTAEEIEKRYDHGQHPNANLQGQPAFAKEE
jgi:SAM-dependent methyltransferase